MHKDKYAQMPDKTLFNPELPPTETAVMRATVPSDVASGPTALQIIGGINSGGGYDSDTVESGFQVGTTSDAVPAARFKPGSRHFLHHHRLKNVPTPSARISSSTLFDPHRRQR